MGLWWWWWDDDDDDDDDDVTSVKPANVCVCVQIRMKELEEALEQEREAHSRVS